MTKPCDLPGLSTGWGGLGTRCDATCRMLMQEPVELAGRAPHHARRRLRSVRLRRSRAAATAVRLTRTSTRCWRPPTPRPVAGWRTSIPSLAAAYPDLMLTAADPALVDGLEVVFLALPHGASQELVPELRKRVGTVVDLAADFRLRDPASYPRWYGVEHRCPDLLAEAVTGIPELFRADLPGATLIAAAGCYPTAAALALAPLARAGMIDDQGVVVDAASGVSGAGRVPQAHTHFNTVDEDFTAYGLLHHRHTPEIEQAVGRAGHLHAPSGADEPRHPGHLLRPPRA